MNAPLDWSSPNRATDRIYQRSVEIGFVRYVSLELWIACGISRFGCSCGLTSEERPLTPLVEADGGLLHCILQIRPGVPTHFTVWKAAPSCARFRGASRFLRAPCRQYSPRRLGHPPSHERSHPAWREWPAYR